jgi:hypothetical protein
MSHRSFAAGNLAAAFLGGAWSLGGLVRRGARACGRQRWLAPLARRVLATFAAPPTPGGLDALSAFIAADAGFQQAWRAHGPAGLPVSELFWVAPQMAPAAGVPGGWQVPALATPAALAAWLGLELPRLEWFADCRGREADVPPGALRHYSYRWVRKGNRRARLLEVPRGRLKAIQRRLAREILNRIPAHDAVHSYRPGRSIATYLAPHAGKRLVLHLDLRCFFPSVRGSRVHALFRKAGYPAEVARLLTGLCTNTVPDDVWGALPAEQRRREAGGVAARLRVPHLPQGAPTSPALANLCAYRLDCRLAGLARSAEADYTRYADDRAPRRREGPGTGPDPERHAA